MVQGERKHVDETADCYALGILLYELCTRQPMAEEGRFIAASDVEGALKTLRGESRLPPRIVRAITGALSDDPPFDTVAGMVAVWSGERSVKRRRWGPRTLVLVAVALVLVAGYVGWAHQLELPDIVQLGISVLLPSSGAAP